MRGDVYRFKGAKDPKRHEQRGPRYAVVIQSDDLPLSTWIVALTSTGARPGPIRPSVEIDGRATVVATDRLFTVDPQARLGELVGRLGHAQMLAVDDALRFALALD
jgi:mRNA interferase MazF